MTLSTERHGGEPALSIASDIARSEYATAVLSGVRRALDELAISDVPVKVIAIDDDPVNSSGRSFEACGYGAVVGMLAVGKAMWER